MSEKKKNIPTPSNDVVRSYLKEWESLEDYREQENAIDNLFHEVYKGNSDLNGILIKCSVLNDFYSTNIFKVYPVAKHIQSISNIDDRLSSGDVELVNEIAKITIEDKEKNFYSFATKYCSHHNQDDYPIYDYYVVKMLLHFKKKDHFCKFKRQDLKDYPKFKSILEEFRKKYNLDFSFKELDRYLWLSGKHFFTRKKFKSAKDKIGDEKSMDEALS